MKIKIMILMGSLLVGCNSPITSETPHSELVIRITGRGVKRPGEYAWHDEQYISKAIESTGGYSSLLASRKVRLFRDPGGFEQLKGSYKVTHAEVREPNGMGNLNPRNDDKPFLKLDCITVNISSIMHKRAPDVLLKPDDWIATWENYD